jgi:Holliday junction resolvasome RuvABC endonuclease subunit
MILLAIDPGSACGWAVHDADRIVASGVWNLAPRRGDSPGVRYLKLRSRLTDVKDRWPELELVAVEQAHHRGGAATEYAIGIVTHVQSWCAEVGVEHLTINTSVVKKAATGRGNADKAAMVAAARAWWPGWEPETDDEADARFIAVAAAAELGRVA